MGRVKDEIIERESNVAFERGVDECENPAFFWINPWSGKREKVAILFWPTHPFEETERIEDLWDLLELRIAPPTPEQGEYVRVPVEPTKAMLDAMGTQLLHGFFKGGDGYDDMKAIWSAALAAQREESE